MTQTVCIIGAGPSGLVAAKSLLHDAPPNAFKVTIFEAQPRIGGLWPLKRDDGAGLVHPLMLVNQSKHTMHFSDLAWEENSPELPRAWQVGQYLQRYLDRYCADAEVRLDSKVEKVEVVEEGRWRVHARSGAVDNDDKNDVRVFDRIIICSGYFGQPFTPPGLTLETEIPVVHSSKYRDLQSLLPAKPERPGGKILVVGGQFSGVEIAGTIGNHLSSSANSPGPSSIPDVDKYSIHHLIQRAPWVFPLTTSPKAALPAAPFLPLDLPSYNLANRPHPLTNTQGHISVESAMLTHSIYENMVGTDQSEFGPELTINGRTQDEPPYLAVSDTYLDHVRSGLITVSRGKLCSVSGSTAKITPSNDEITDIAAVILATGFDASTSLSFLPESVLSTLAIAPDDLNHTVALAFHGTHHPSVPNLGFVGFYRSPYWGVMEMQARFLAALWSHPTPDDLPEAMRLALAADTSIDRTLALRTDPRASQFPMGDYAYLMQEFAAALDLTRAPQPAPTPPLPHNNASMDILTPSRYPPRHMSEAQQAENAAALRQTHETAMAGLMHGRFVARAVFRSLLGSWSLRRTVTSALPSHPSGTFEGTARFLLRDGTADGRGSGIAATAAADGTDPGLEYLYIENGVFTSADNPAFSFPATRRYVWRYDEAKDVLSVWFVRTDDALRADYLFHDVQFVPPGDDTGRKGWEAKAGHLCVEDYYDVKYEFRFRAVNLAEWKIGYVVKGPKKDYCIDGVYKRVEKA